MKETQAGVVISTDATQLAESITGLLNNSSMKQKLRKNGKMLVKEKFTCDNIAEQMIKAYENVIVSNKQ